MGTATVVGTEPRQPFGGWPVAPAYPSAPYPAREIDNSDARLLKNLKLRALLDSISPALRSKWLWYSVMSLMCWTAWALTAKVGCSELPPATMQFVSALGFVFVSAIVSGRQEKGVRSNGKGKFYSVISGVLLGLGGIALFAAYRTGQNTAAITGITSLYPVITVLCAVVVLKEKLGKWQILGLCFSGVAILLLSF